MMYTVSSKSSKLVATRRGISQNYETFRDLGRKSEDYPEISLPKPVFHTPPQRKYQNQHQMHHHGQHHMQQQQQASQSPQHEEIVKFVYDTWCTVAVDNPYEVPSSPDSAISMNSSSDRLSGHHNQNNTNAQKAHRVMSKSSSSSSSTSSSSGYTAPALIYYTDKPDPRLQDFKAFDLEAWWGRRLYNNIITKSL